MIKRPDLNRIFEKIGDAYLRCKCSEILQTKEAVIGHWERGHMDVPDPQGISLARMVLEMEEVRYIDKCWGDLKETDWPQIVAKAREILCQK